MTRTQRSIALGVVLVLLVGVVALVAGPARGLRSDIATQKSLLRQQLATTRSQLTLQQQQLSVARQLLALAQALNSIARDTRRHAANIDRKTGPPAP